MLKSILTIICYGLRYVIEGSIFHEFKKISKLILDMAFVGIILITYNIANFQHAHGFGKFIQEFNKLVDEGNAMSGGIVAVLFAFGVWGAAIYLNKRYENASGKYSRGAFFAASGFLALVNSSCKCTTEGRSEDLGGRLVI